MKNFLVSPILGLVLSSVAYGAVADQSQVPPTQSPVKESDGLSGFVNASFIYWYAKEEGLDVAESAVLGNSGQTLLSNEGTVFQQGFSYDPGFKIGGGVGGDGWSLFTEYTWLRSSNTTSKTAPANDTSASGTGVWNIDDWFLQTTTLGRSPTGTYLSSTCKLGFDIVDLLAGNPIYEKKQVKVDGLVGLRSAWIRQNMNISLTQAAASVGTPFLPNQPIQSLNSSHSWGIGPKLGMTTQFLLPKGFRIEGLFAASLLYTKFSSIKHSEDAVSKISINSSGVVARTDSYSSVRPEMQANLGIGWEFDFDNGSSLDFAASYDFTIFWGQNVMRKMLDEFWVGTNASPGDLYLQGLTIDLRFKF
jgi:hypothetical protein